MDQKQKQLYEPWLSYSQTILDFGAVVVDLTFELEKSALAALPFEGPFGIVTACDPHGLPLPFHENEIRMDQLKAELVSSCEMFVELDACSHDRTHCERSVALVADRLRVIEVARKWEQLAIYWFDGQTFWIYGALSATAAIQLPVD